MKYKLFTILFIIGLSCHVQAMEDDAGAILKAQIAKIKAEGPLVIVGAYLINRNQQLLLGHEIDSNTWGALVKPYKNTDDGFEKCATRIVSETTGMTAYNVKRFNDSITSGGTNIRYKDAIVPLQFLMINYATRDFVGDAELVELQPSADNTVVHLPHYKSLQWFDKNNLPANIHPLTMPRESLYNLLKYLRD